MPALLAALVLLLLAGTFCLALAPELALRRISTPEGLAAALRRKPEHARLAELVSAVSAESWARSWAEALLDEPDPFRRATLTDFALADLERDLEARSKWPASAARLAGLGGLLLAVLAFLTGLAPAFVGAPLVAGALALGLALSAGRRSAELAARERARADALVDALEALFAASPASEAERGAVEEARERRPARAWRSWGRR